MDCQLHDVDIRRLNDPTDRYEHIMEEFEKNDSRVPKWKVEWVRENLTTMIGKDDAGAKTKASPTKGRRGTKGKAQDAEAEEDLS